MSLFDNLAIGFTAATTLQNLSLAFVGCLCGTLIGVLPGLGPLATMAMLLPLTFYFPPESALIMLAGIYYGAQYGGSTTAILVNLPGESSSAVTCIDGHQMARAGRAGAALAIAAGASFLGGTVATMIIALFAPALAEVSMAFGAQDYFALMLFGLVGATALSGGSMLKSIGMVLFGVQLGCIGLDINSGTARFTGGLTEFMDDIDFVPLAIGIFGLSEIIMNLQRAQVGQVNVFPTGRLKLWPTREEFRLAWPAAVRGTAIGSLLGILPGGGALLSSFTSYALEARLSPTPERFGKGAVEGVAGPEAANNAGSQTSFIPMLALGIPSNPIMAIMIGALIMQGIVPGPQIMTQRPELVWGLIASMWIGNVMLLVINLPLIRLWVSMLRIPYHMLFPLVILLCGIGAYSVSSSTFDVLTAAALALIGFLLARFECSPVPLALGFILGPALEENLRRALVLSAGEFDTFVTSPISLSLLIATAALTLALLTPHLARTRRETFKEDDA